MSDEHQHSDTVDLLSDLVGTALAIKLANDSSVSAYKLKKDILESMERAGDLRKSLALDEVTHLPEAKRAEVAALLKKIFNMDMDCCIADIAAAISLSAARAVSAHAYHASVRYEELVVESVSAKMGEVLDRRDAENIRHAAEHSTGKSN